MNHIVSTLIQKDSNAINSPHFDKKETSRAHLLHRRKIYLFTTLKMILSQNIETNILIITKLTKDSRIKENPLEAELDHTYQI